MQEAQETWVQFQGPEDPLEEGRATHSSILAGRIPWTEEPGRLQSRGVSKSQTQLNTHTHSSSTSWVQVCDALILPQPNKVVWAPGKHL